MTVTLAMEEMVLPVLMTKIIQFIAAAGHHLIPFDDDFQIAV